MRELDTQAICMSIHQHHAGSSLDLRVGKHGEHAEVRMDGIEPRAGSRNA